VRELSLHILDLLENAIEAGATLVQVQIVEDHAKNRLIIEITDNGHGMDRATLERVTDPFFTTRKTRHIGLGIPLLKAATERCGGGLTIESEPGKGTRVRAEFVWDHIDRAPLGDMRSTLLAILVSNTECDLVYRHRVDDRVFELDTREIRQHLGDVPLSHPRVWRWLDDYIAEGLRELYRKGNNALCSNEHKP